MEEAPGAGEHKGGTRNGRMDHNPQTATRTTSNPNLFERLTLHTRRASMPAFTHHDRRTKSNAQAVIIEATQEELGLAPEWFTADYNVDEAIFRALPEDVTEEWLDKEIVTKGHLKTSIEATLSSRVISSYGHFVQGMTQIQHLGFDLQMTAFLCKSSRQRLAAAKAQLTTSSFTILSLNKRKTNIQAVLNHLENIQNILVMEKRIRQLTEIGDFPAAIAECLECKKKISDEALAQFHCIRSLNSSLQEDYSALQRKLSASLLSVCSNFQPDIYSCILTAYQLLGKTERVVDKLQRYFHQAINSDTYHILANQLLALQAIPNTKNTGMHYRDMCLLLKDEHFTDCLEATFQALEKIMQAHHAMVTWHRSLTSSNIADVEHMKKMGENIAALDKALWTEMQRRVSAIVTTVNLESFQIDQFMQVLSQIKKFTDAGEGYSGSESNLLVGSIKKQSKDYFLREHQSRLEDLPTIMEAENWAKMPVKLSYSVRDVKELRNFIRSDDEDTADAEEEIDPRLLAPYVDEGDGAPPPVLAMQPTLLHKDERILASTAIRFLQYIGKYLHMMDVLKPIAFEIFVGITHIFQYYLYTVYQVFGSGPMAEDLMNQANPELLVTLKKIGTQLIHQPGSEKKKCSIEPAHLSRGVELSETNAYAVPERIVAVESLSFMACAMQAIKPRLKGMLPKSRDAYFERFYANTVDMIPALQRHLYRTSVLLLIDLDPFVAKITNVKWDITQFGVEHNDYVNAMLKEFQVFEQHLGIVAQKRCLLERAKDTLWNYAIIKAMDVLVEGFSRVKKCSAEGRGLMKLDFQTFQTGLFKLTPIRPLPGASRVDTFITAFYEPETELPKWLQEHYPEYTAKQLLGLIQIMPFKRRVRTELSQLVQDMEKESQAKRYIIGAASTPSSTTTTPTLPSSTAGVGTSISVATPPISSTASSIVTTAGPTLSALKQLSSNLRLSSQVKEKDTTLTPGTGASTTTSSAENTTTTST
eukprot:TRINITY_DN9420_c0_g2_i2.p1 TRINITY_DN9420_c0_g2~~TRINITY_DN9420_c0_g2_i2.p1  ORF type:complete len:987 (+),score=113.27 TRINITY_DN9420_c0_g2_i2:1-2961(+)